MLFRSAGAPQNTVIGGASLWVMSGKKAEEYKGVAAFFNYISSPEVQSASHKRTGYLPITTAAYQLTEKSGFYKEKPGTDVAVTQMIRKVTDKSRGIRLGNYVQVRAIEDEELEQVWSGKKTAKEALDAIVKRGDEQLERFFRGFLAAPDLLQFFVFNRAHLHVVAQTNASALVGDLANHLRHGHVGAWFFLVKA